MLLVSDEAADTVMVLDVVNDALTVIGELAPDCPHLRRPTALAVDDCNRVLVGCQDGAVILLQT